MNKVAPQGNLLKHVYIGQSLNAMAYGGAHHHAISTKKAETKGVASERRKEEAIRMKEEAIRMDVPQLGTGAKARVQGVAQSRPFVGSNNAALQAAIQRGFSGAGRNAQYAGLWRQYAAQRTIGSGRRTVGLESPKVAGATKTKAAKVRVMKDTV